MAQYVSIELQDGTVSNVFANEDTNVVFIERGVTTEEGKTFESIGGNSGTVIGVYASTVPDYDLAEVWETAQSDGLPPCVEEDE